MRLATGYLKPREVRVDDPLGPPLSLEKKACTMVIIADNVVSRKCTARFWTEDFLKIFIKDILIFSAFWRLFFYIQLSERRCFSGYLR